MKFKNIFYSIAFIFCFGLTGCAFNAKLSQLGSYGADHRIDMYSGGEKVESWTSSGKVVSETNSDGYYFKDKDTGVLVRVTGDLVITPID